MASGGRYTSSSTESDGYYPPARGRHSGDDDRVYQLTSNLRVSKIVHHIENRQYLSFSFIDSLAFGVMLGARMRAFAFPAR